MRFNKSFQFYATAYGVALTAVSDIREVAARIVGPADIRENIKESKSFVKNKGEECIKLEADIPKNKTDTENVDIGVLGCGEALICLEDESSSTGARCVDLVEVEDCRYDSCDLNGSDECCDGSQCRDFDGFGGYCLASCLERCDSTSDCTCFEHYCKKGYCTPEF